MSVENLSRRAFLGRGMALGGIVAVSSLPAFAEDDPALFPERGRFERLSMAYHHIHAGATKPFSVLHISDTHLTAAYPHEDEKKQKLKARRSRTFGGRQEEALRDSLAWAKQHVNYVLHTGDLIDWQSEANFDLVRKYYGEGGKMMFGCLGNHEHSGNMWLDDKTEKPNAEKVRSLLETAYPFDTTFASTVINGVNFITLDDAPGTVTPAQVERFKAEVEKGLPIILCMHVPFTTPHIWRAATRFWTKTNFLAIPDATRYEPNVKDPTTRDFIAYLKTQPLLKGILAGHLHITVADRFSPTAVQYLVGGNFLFHGAEITIT